MEFKKIPVLILQTFLSHYLSNEAAGLKHICCGKYFRLKHFQCFLRHKHLVLDCVYVPAHVSTLIQMELIQLFNCLSVEINGLYNILPSSTLPPLERLIYVQI